MSQPAYHKVLSKRINEIEADLSHAQFLLDEIENREQVRSGDDKMLPYLRNSVNHFADVLLELQSILGEIVFEELSYKMGMSDMIEIPVWSRH